MHKVVRLLDDLPNADFGTDGHVFALTFDDGPGPATPEVAGALESAQALASFFVLGYNIAAGSETVRNLAEAGHCIGGHSWSHERSDRLSDDEVVAEHERTSAALTQATGLSHSLIRPPYGIDNQRIADLLGDQGFTTVFWSIDPRDWDNASALEIATSVLSALHPGAIVILHDGGGARRSTIEAIPLIIHGARLMGYEPVTLQRATNLSRASSPSRSES